MELSLQLSFNTHHLSIRNFPQIELPQFTVVTGRNGSGKSHMLEAIVSGDIRCIKDGNLVVPNPNDIGSYSWANLVPQDTGVFSSETSRNEKQNVLNHIKSMLQGHGISNWLRQQANAHGLSTLSDRELLQSSAEELDALLPGANSLSYTIQRSSFLATHENNLRNSGDPFLSAINLAKTLNKSLFSITETELLQSTVPNYGSSQLFQQSFARLFVEYRDFLLRNDLQELAFEKGRTNIPALTSSEFTDKHGQAPWDFVNSSFEQAGLDFLINVPDLVDYAAFQPKLTKKSTNDEIQFQNLSSGEKIIMSFAFCLYYATDKRQLSSYPKLLLLDEVDAPLHPTMTRSLLNTINNILVKEYNIAVILTTHSPSTVALSPEDSICIMLNGRDGLRKNKKSEALNLLTEGVPTISLSYSGRRQVFVESTADAETYALLYDLARKYLPSERSLDFISTGIKDGSGIDRNTGCIVVRKLVDEISMEGNTSVFGILDWDGKQVGTDRIVVLAAGRRNGLENVLLDPLIVAAVICRDFHSEKWKIDVPSEVSYLEFLKWNAVLLQPVVCKVCEVVLGKAAGSLHDVSYFCGISLQIDDEYMKMDDHKLEAALLVAFPSLNSLSRGKAGGMMQKIIATVIADQYNWTPSVAHDLFQDILSRSSH